MALLAWWGHVFHSPQRNNTSGEDITGFDNLWPVSSQFGHCLNSPVWRSQWHENLIQVSVTSVAVSGFALGLRTSSTPAACRTMPAFSSCCHWHCSWMSQISYTWNSTVLVDSHFSPLCHNVASLHHPVLGGCQLTELQDLQSWQNPQLPFFPGQQPTMWPVWQTDTPSCLSWDFVKWCDTFGQKDVKISTVYQENMLGEDF